MVTEPVGYFQDQHSGAILRFEGKWDLKEMANHPEYRQVTEKDWKEYIAKRESKEQ